VESSDNHGLLDEQRAGSKREGTDLAGSDDSGRDALHDANNDSDSLKEGVDHDTRAAQLLYGVADAFWEEEYTSRLPFQMSCLEVAVRLRPDNAEYWYDLGRTYYTAAQWSGSVEAHDRAVIAYQNALQGADEPTQHDPGRFSGAVAAALHERFKAVGRPEDLDQAVALHRDALAMRPPGHPQRDQSLNNLAISLGLSARARGSRTGEIDEVIRLQKETLEFLPQGHEDTGQYPFNLAVKVRFCYEMTESIVDLEEAIRLGREALELYPSGHRFHAWTLNELAWNLTLLYEALGDSGSLEEAIRISRKSLAIFPIGSPQRGSVLDTLATALRFVQDHLDEALQLSRESLSLTPLNHSSRWEVMLTLASILLSHYERSGSAEDLEGATLVCTQALSLCPPNHIRRPKLLAVQAKLAEATSSSSFKS
jgi:tetratricopeptide (TPR) repeat protein